MQMFSRHCTTARRRSGSPNSGNCRKIPRRPISSSWN